MIALSALLACGSIATHEHGRIASFGTSETTAAVSVSQFANPVLGVVPFPVVDLVHRVPLGPDADLGLKLLGGAPGVDLRRRLVRRERLDVTVGPELSAAYLPTNLIGTASQGLAGVGFLNLESPVLATARLGSRQWLTLAVTPGLRVIATNSNGDGLLTEDINTVAPLVGAGLRWSVEGRRVGFGVSLDVQARPGRGAPLAWGVSLQEISVVQRLRHRTRRAMKRTAGR